MKDKPEFEFSKLNLYFHKGVIDYDPITKEEIRFNNDVLYDDNQIFWKQNCIKYEIVDDIKLVNSFKKNFSSQSSFLSSVVKGRIIEAYRQYGREKFETLLQVPGNSIVFSNYLIYLGKNLEKDIDLEKVKDQLVDDNKIIKPYYTFFVTNPIPHDYISDEEKIKCPMIDQYFTDWIGEANKEMLYELIGYCMLPSYPIHRIFILYGGGRNGKSSFLDILERVVGTENTTASDIHTLTEDRFGTAGLYKKLVCLISETDYHKIDRTSILKRLSGNDSVNAQFKNKPAFNFKNYAKIIIATNTIPQMQDKTLGNMSRYVIIDFPKTFDEKEDILTKIPEEEYTALANICVRKLERLLKTRRFTNEKTQEEKAKFYEQKSNPLDFFIKSNCETYIDSDIPQYEFEDRYIFWLKQNGYSSNFSKSWLAKEMEEKGFIRTRKKKTMFGNTTQYYYFENIKFKESKVVIEPVIEQEKEYNIKEMAQYLKENYKIPETSPGYTDEFLIKKFKADLRIYEPKNGVYKIYKGDLNVSHA